jgi:hypothetical protein
MTSLITDNFTDQFIAEPATDASRFVLVPTPSNDPNEPLVSTFLTICKTLINAL